MQVRSLLMVASAAILVSTAAFGQSASDTVFQIHPFTNLVNIRMGSSTSPTVVRRLA